MRIAIVGGGAAGCFCAAQLRHLLPQADIHIFEANNRLLAKVAITGGGRCNLTNSFREVVKLQDVYPRGDKLMKRALSQFSHTDTFRWFEQHKVRLITQEDECVFPQSQDAMQIVQTLINACEGTKVHLSTRITEITEDKILYFEKGNLQADYIIIAMGGQPRESGFSPIQQLPIKLVSPVPSLFTFNIDSKECQELMGNVVEDVEVSLAGTKFKAHGALLFTHWGMSGPAILKLSSHAARHLAENQYKGTLLVNWMGNATEDEVRDYILDMATEYSANQISNRYPNRLTQRHWQSLLDKCHIPSTQRWGALNDKMTNRLVNALIADTYNITGRCHYKEEFVTCGGISLKEINPNTMQIRHLPDIYAIGEVTDVDAVTGGFNLQAAWSMAWCAAKHIAESVNASLTS